MTGRIKDFEWYASRVLKIQTKTSGLKPFDLMPHQAKYVHHIKNDFPDGIVRSIVLKSRQSGFSTLIAGMNIHRMATERDCKVIMLADKFGRSVDVHNIYSRFVNNLPEKLRPMISKNNEREIEFDNPILSNRKARPGLGSSLKTETAQDPNAGRSGTRKIAHMTEAAFFAYASQIDEGVQNSIPLASGTYIVKESTAWGKQGIGESFYKLWCAAEKGESIYKPFFVSWFECPDYACQVPHGFILSIDEVDLIKKCPEITNENIAWRRLKLLEYAASSDSVFTPEERFKQDFPSTPEEAFLSTGRPVFDQEKLHRLISWARSTPAEVKKIVLKQPTLAQFPTLLTVYSVPEKGKKYLIGCDISEGTALGDSSSAFVMDSDHKQVAVFHGKIDPDLLGKVLVELAKIYNEALIIPEINNMGYSTLSAIKNEGYLKVYMRSVFDEIEEGRETKKMGWRTTSKTKQDMLNRLIAWFRDGEILIKDINLLQEMASLSRESSGDVELTGKDRVVACCLAVMGVDQIYEPAIVIDPYAKKQLQLEKRDLFRDVEFNHN